MPLIKKLEDLFPRWGARRQSDRMALEQMRQLQAMIGPSYRGSFPGRMERNWPRQLGITGQTFMDRAELRSMRDRSRNVDRNNPIGQGMLNRLVDNVVGEGFTLQAKSSSPAWNAECEDRFGAFVEDADVRGTISGQELLRRFYRGSLCDGDGGLVLVSKGGVPKLQAIEGDQIYQPDGYALTPTFVDGVEMDRVGRALRYWVLDAPQGGVRHFTPVPAQNFVFFPHFSRYGNNIVRGEPCFRNTYTLFDQVDGYIDAVAVAARMAAIFGLVFKEQTAAQQLANLSLNNGSGDVTKAFTVDESGMVRWIGGKDAIVQVQAQQPMQQTPDFIAALLRIIGLPMDMPLELVLLDFSRVNFSSARAAFLQFYQAMIPRQQYFRVRVMSRVFRWWLAVEQRFERFTNPVPPDAARHHFMARGWQWVNPLQEAQTALLEVAMGVNSPQRVAARLGRDYDQIQAEIVADFKARQLAGLPINVSSMTRDALGMAMEATKRDLDQPNQDAPPGGQGGDDDRSPGENEP